MLNNKGEILPTPSQDARRRMKELAAHASASQALANWDDAMTEDRMQFVHDMVEKLGSSLCLHLQDVDMGDVEAFVSAPNQSIVCVDCYQTGESLAYLVTTDCDWCSAPSEWFTEIVITIPDIAMHTMANLCDDCVARLSAPV